MPAKALDILVLVKADGVLWVRKKPAARGRKLPLHGLGAVPLGETDPANFVLTVHPYNNSLRETQ